MQRPAQRAPEDMLLPGQERQGFGAVFRTTAAGILGEEKLAGTSPGSFPREARVYTGVRLLWGKRLHTENSSSSPLS